MTTPIQGTVCNPNAKLSPGEPVYKILSQLSLAVRRYDRGGL